MAEKKVQKPVRIGTSGYASYLTQQANQPRLTGEDLFGGAIDYLQARMVLAETTTAEFLKNIPEDFSTEIVPVETRGQLTTWMQGQKDQLTDISRQLGKMSHKRNSEEYIALEKEYNAIKSSFEIVQSDLKSLQAFNDLNVDAIKKMASGQKLDDILAAKDFIGKEGYKHLIFENSGVYYNHPTLGKTKVTDLASLPTRDKNLHLDFYKLGDFAQAAANEGINLGYDENGAPLNSQTAQLQATLNIFFENETFARDLIFGGLEGYDNTKYIDVHMAEKHPDLVRGTVDYQAKLEEYREEPPIKDAQKFYFKVLGDDVNQQELDRLKNKKTTSPSSPNRRTTEDYRKASVVAESLSQMFDGSSVKLNNRFYKLNPNNPKEVIVQNLDREEIGSVSVTDVITENLLGFDDLQNQVLDQYEEKYEPKESDGGGSGDDKKSKIPNKYTGSRGFASLGDSDTFGSAGRFFSGLFGEKTEMKGYKLRPSGFDFGDGQGKVPSYDVTMEDGVYTVPIELLKWLSRSSSGEGASDVELLEQAARLIRQDGAEFWLEEIKNNPIESL